jgi:hypothetical protein
MTLDATCMVVGTDDSIDAGLVGRVLGRYREMPGLVRGTPSLWTGTAPRGRLPRSGSATRM